MCPTPERGRAVDLLQFAKVLFALLATLALIAGVAWGARRLGMVRAGEAGGAPLEYIQALRQRFGLDQPVLVQLGLYVKNILALDLGYSFRNQSPVLPLILARLWPTLLLMGTTLILSVAGGVLLGLLAAIWVRTWKDHVISFAAIIAYAMPLFWIGLMLILVFSINLDWLPTSGMEDAAAFYEGWERVVDIACHDALLTSELVRDHLKASPEAMKRFSRVVTEAYKSADRALGEYMAAFGEANVIVVSDHGFTLEAGAAPHLRSYNHPAFRAGRVEGLSIFDLLPLLLHLKGFPLAEDLPGRVPREVLSDLALARAEVTPIPGYGVRRSTGAWSLPAQMDEEMLERLRALGYLQ